MIGPPVQQPKETRAYNSPCDTQGSPDRLSTLMRSSDPNIQQALRLVRGGWRGGGHRKGEPSLSGL
jgi:hypothetical protein